MNTIRVVVAEDEPEVRAALLDLLAAEPDIDVIGAARDTDEVISLCAVHGPDVVVMDVKMPGGGGPRATRSIRRQRVSTRVVALSAYQDRTTILEMLRAGAEGYVMKGSPPSELITAIHQAAGGRAVLSPVASAELVDELSLRLRAEEDVATERLERAARVRRAIDGDLRMVFQPIVELAGGQTVGVEALARFGGRPARSPDLWFADAADIGLRSELEHRAFETAIAATRMLPDDWYLAINLSPQTIVEADLWGGVPDDVMRRLVIEITEHAPVHDYEVLRRKLALPQSYGGRVAVDDAGAGFASLRHILLLRPDLIKIDATLTQDLDRDRPRRALATALISFASEIDARVVAEGIERERDLRTLEDLGVDFGQGYLLGRPVPAEELRGVGPQRTNPARR